MKPGRLAIAAAMLPLLAPSARAHRLDEYLQATLISLEKDRVEAAMRLVPGVAVSTFVLSGIDTNNDGVISQAEGQVYAKRVLDDVSFSLDGHVLTPRLTAVEFPGPEEMKAGLGEIHIQFSAALPRGGLNRRLIFENHHQNRIAAYLVNCLVPRDRAIKVVSQDRNPGQSLYQLDYEQAGAASLLPGWQDQRLWLGAGAFLLFVRLAFLWRQTRLMRSRSRPGAGRQATRISLS